MSTIYDLKELVTEIQRPLAPWHPDYPGDAAYYVRRPKPWTLTEALRQLRECPSDKWRDATIDRLRRCGFKVPDYITHTLVDHLIELGALTRRKVK